MAVPPDRCSVEVLVVDDDPDVRDLLFEFFRGRGLVCATAQDGRAAIAALERSGGRYGLVFTDIVMPGADGFAVLAAAHAANPATSVVMITGFAALDTAIEAVRSGAHDYVTKPFSLGQIDGILRRVVARADRDADRRATSTRGVEEAAAVLDRRLGAIDARLEGVERDLSRVLAIVARVAT